MSNPLPASEMDALADELAPKPDPGLPDRPAPGSAGLLDAEHLPVGFHGIGRRQGGGRNRLSPPGRDQRGAPGSRGQHLD